MGLLDKAKQRLATMQESRQEASLVRAESRAVTNAQALQVREHRANYESVLSTLQWLDADEEALIELGSLRALADLPAKDASKLAESTFRRCSEEALEDDVLSATEEGRLLKLAEVLEVNSLQDPQWVDLNERLVIARVNDGRLPELSGSNVTIILKRGETAHASVIAALLKEVVTREWQGGSSGYSFRVMKGVHYRVGNSRGRMATVAPKSSQRTRARSGSHPSGFSFEATGSFLSSATRS